MKISMKKFLMDYYVMTQKSFDIGGGGIKDFKAPQFKILLLGKIRKL